MLNYQHFLIRILLENLILITLKRGTKRLRLEDKENKIVGYKPHPTLNT